MTNKPNRKSQILKPCWFERTANTLTIAAWEKNDLQLLNHLDEALLNGGKIIIATATEHKTYKIPTQNESLP